ncbi:MAG: FG-GAP-like repeat-containing protein [Verrucomicrobiota bacterium]
MRIRVLFAIGMGLWTSLQPGFAQGTAFTYNGRLTDNSAAASGSYDLRFTLYGAVTNGSPLGVLTNTATSVSAGVFLVQLDFGGVFTGANYWLELAVRTNGSGAFTPLNPRQPITPTPYAIYAPTAGYAPNAGYATNAGVAATANAVAATHITGTLAPLQLPSSVVQTGGGAYSLYGTFTGNGATLTNLNSGSLTGNLTVGVTLLETARINRSAGSVTVAGDYAYVSSEAGFGSDVGIYNISQLANPIQVGVITNFSAGYLGDDYQWGSHAVALAGTNAYVADVVDGLRIYDISNPANPQLMAKTNFSASYNRGGVIYHSQPVGVAVAGNFAYVACSFDGVRIVNIANPTNPVPVGHVAMGPDYTIQGLADYSVNVAVYGRYLFVAKLLDGVSIYDVANPTNAVYVAGIQSSGVAHSVTVAPFDSGVFLYVANGVNGVNIFDVTDLSEPGPTFEADYYVGTANYHEGNPNMYGGAIDAAVVGKNLYVANSGDGIRLYDISYPAVPSRIGAFSPEVPGSYAAGIAVVGTNVFLANHDSFRIFRNVGVAVRAPKYVGDGSLLTSLDASQITTGTLSLTRFPTNVLLNGNTNVNLTGNFAGNGSALTGLDASQLASGTVPLARLPGSLITNSATGVTLSGSFTGAFTGNGAGLTNLSFASFNGDLLPLTFWSLALTNPAGDFATISNICGGPMSVQLADFNNDGRLDVAVMGFYGRLVVLTNNGAGGFMISSAPGAGYLVNSLAVADVNGDGALDLINASSYNSTLTLMTNDGLGGFTAASTPAVGETTYVVAADVNGDGKADLINVGFYSSTVTILTNGGSGNFTLSSTNQVGNGHFNVVAADVNGDGKVDLITPNYYDSTVTVLTNNGNGEFVAAGTYPAGIGGARFVAAGDFNRDGRVDLAVANDTTGTLTTLTNNGSGGFVAVASYPVGAGPAAVAISDLNRDGWPDLICANYESNSVTILTNNGSGGFATAATFPAGAGPVFVAAGDLNGDGTPDILAANFSDSTLALINNPPFFPSRFRGQFTGDGGSLSNLNANAISSGGLTVNLQVLVPGGGTNTLCFTNGILRAIQ